MTSYQRKIDKVTFLLYAFGFLLIWEWIRPLEQLTNTGNIEFFLFFLILSFSLYFLGMKIWPRWIVKSLYILVALHNLYYTEPFFAFDWVGPIITELVVNIARIFNTEWPQLTNLFRSLLFFLLLWIMAYLLRYWLIKRRKILTFFIMTMIYITVLDTFSSYVAEWAIVRTVISGFIVMGMLTFYRQIERTGAKMENAYIRKWMIPLLSMIAFSVAVGFIAPKADPIWPDPVPYIKSYSENSGGVNRVGYGEDDSKLGGPFIGDDQLVFRAEVDSRHYWKVETKDVYTGKGWVATDSNNEMIPFSQNDFVPVSTFSTDVETVEESATIVQLKKYSHILYPNGIKRIVSIPTISYEMHPTTEKLYSIQQFKKISLDEYELIYEVPKYSVEELTGSAKYDPVIDNEFFKQRFTQLPPSLPNRVRELAQEITAGKETWYEQARAIENYFDRPEYYYDKTDVMIPGEEDDYVDQFLFDSKQGYCDNFSSSMVVMLRSIGIPSRWVKGYTEGEFKRLSEDSKRIFEVTNNNAHSWVEVYFPNVGWVPFEPTKGFTNNVLFTFDTNQNSTSTSETEAAVKKQEEKPDDMEKDQVEKHAPFSLEKIWESSKELVAKQLKSILLTSFLIVFIVLLLYRGRKKWLPFYFIWKYKRRNHDEHFAKAYMELLKHLERNGLKRKENQTLRDFSLYIDRFYSTNAMGKLTSRYEQYLYKGSLQEGSWLELRELWEKLIIKTIA